MRLHIHTCRLLADLPTNYKCTPKVSSLGSLHLSGLMKGFALIAENGTLPSKKAVKALEDESEKGRINFSRMDDTKFIADIVLRLKVGLSKYRWVCSNGDQKRIVFEKELFLPVSVCELNICCEKNKCVSCCNGHFAYSNERVKVAILACSNERIVVAIL